MTEMYVRNDFNFCLSSSLEINKPKNPFNFCCTSALFINDFIFTIYYAEISASKQTGCCSELKTSERPLVFPQTSSAETTLQQILKISLVVSITALIAYTKH